MYRYKCIIVMFCLLFLLPVLGYTQNHTNQASIISNGDGMSSGGELYTNYAILGEPIVNQSVSGGIYESLIGFRFEGFEDLSVDEFGENISQQFKLRQNYPNPFNNNTSICYSLPKSCNIKLQIYNIKGQLVETLINEYKPAGYHTVEWDANDMSSGIYFYKLSTHEKTFIKKMIFMR